MISALNRQTDNTFELTITIPWDRVASEYKKTLSNLATLTSIDGFRQGKAPDRKVEEKLGKEKVQEETLKTLIPVVYIEAINEHKLKPIVSPKVTLNASAENKDWQITAISCEAPSIVLGDYIKTVKDAIAADKIWLPGKDKTGESADNKPDENKTLDKVFKSLLDNIHINVPALIIDDEVNRMLARLIDQTQKLGITVEQYLESVNKTNDQIKDEYRQQASGIIRLEFILSAIADAENTTVDDKEVDDMINAVPDEATRKSLNTPDQRIYLRQLLRKRHVIDKLTKL